MADTGKVETLTGDRPFAYLERHAEAGGPIERIPLLNLPLTIGRAETAGLTVYSSKVSKEHAMIAIVGARYVVRDLDSTNGTFVNGERATEQVLKDGDIIHIAQIEFAFHVQPIRARVSGRTSNADVERTQLVEADQPESVIRGSRLLREMIRDEACDILYQPIVELGTRVVVGYEALCRGAHPELGSDPAALLRLAEQCGLVVELSQMLARLAVTASGKLPRGAKLFVNLHALELTGPGFLESLAVLQTLAGDRHIVLEIPESSINDVKSMAEKKAAFAAVGFEFAYDDFGAGQGRLIELTDIPPHYLKFDRAMFDGIHAAKTRQELVGALVRVARGLDVHVIAEGIETEEVATICYELGCDLGQGYLFGRPA